MMFIKKLTSIASALMLAGSVYAGQQELCPDINDIKAEGLSMAEQIVAGIFFSYNLSDYNTESQWGFMIAPIEADSSEEAIDTANDLLSEMTAPGIPQDTPLNETVCVYNTGHQNIMAAAVHADHMMTPSQLRKYIKHIH